MSVRDLLIFNLFLQFTDGLVSYQAFALGAALTSVSAEYFGSRLFDDKTFADLQDSELPVKRPYLLIGATDLSTAKLFNFTRTQLNCIGSDLSKFPIGHAVAAS